jgi:hypothetical protein
LTPKPVLSYVERVAQLGVSRRIRGK